MSILDKLREPYLKEKEKLEREEKRIRKLEKRCSTGLSFLRFTVFTTLTAVALAGGIYFIGSLFQDKNDLRKVTGRIGVQMQIGNYQQAHHQLLNGSKCGDELMGILSGISLGNISSPSVGSYYHFHHPELHDSLLESKVYELSSSPATLLSRMIFPNGKEYQVFVDSQNTIRGYNLEEQVILGKFPGEIQGKLHPLNSSEFVAANKDGFVYKGSLASYSNGQIGTNFSILFYAGAGNSLSDLTSFTYQGKNAFAFVTQKGDFYAIDDSGKTLLSFSSPVDPAKNTDLIPPKITDPDRLEGMFYQDGELIYFNQNEVTHRTAKLETQITNNNLGLWLNPNKYLREVNFWKVKNGLVVISADADNKRDWKGFSGNVYSERIIDVNRDGIEDWIVGGECRINLRLGKKESSSGELYQFSTKPEFSNSYFVTSPLVLDINSDGKDEIIVGTDEDKLYFFDPAKFSSPRYFTLDSALKEVVTVTLDGRSYLNLVTENRVLFFDLDWFKGYEL